MKKFSCSNPRSCKGLSDAPIFEAKKALAFGSDLW